MKKLTPLKKKLDKKFTCYIQSNSNALELKNLSFGRKNYNNVFILFNEIFAPF